MVMRMSVAEADRRLRSGDIDGFRWGRIVEAVREAILVRGGTRKFLRPGDRALAVKFSKREYALKIGNKEWTAKQKDFRTVKEVVLETWRA